MGQSGQSAESGRRCSFSIEPALLRAQARDEFFRNWTLERLSLPNRSLLVLISQDEPLDQRSSHRVLNDRIARSS